MGGARSQQVIGSLLAVLRLQLVGHHCSLSLGAGDDLCGHLEFTHGQIQANPSEPQQREHTMNTTHTTRFLSVLMALATTALMLSGIDGLAITPMPDALLSQVGAEAIRLAS
jgi:hypothetical protein